MHLQTLTRTVQNCLLYDSSYECKKGSIVRVKLLCSKTSLKEVLADLVTRMEYLMCKPLTTVTVHKHGVSSVRSQTARYFWRLFTTDLQNSLGITASRDKPPFYSD